MSRTRQLSADERWRQKQRKRRLKVRRAKAQKLGMTVHPAAPGPEESADDRRKNRNARKRARRVGK